MIHFIIGRIEWKKFIWASSIFLWRICGTMSDIYRSGNASRMMEKFSFRIEANFFSTCLKFSCTSWTFYAPLIRAWCVMMCSSFAHNTQMGEILCTKYLIDSFALIAFRFYGNISSRELIAWCEKWREVDALIVTPLQKSVGPGESHEQHSIFSCIPSRSLVVSFHNLINTTSNLLYFSWNMRFEHSCQNVWHSAMTLWVLMRVREYDDGP